MKRRNLAYNPWKADIVRHPPILDDPADALGLAFLSVKPASAARYVRAFMGFSSWFDQFAEPDKDFGEILADYVWWAFDSKLVSKQQCHNLLAVSALLMPRLKSDGTFLQAQLALKGWGKSVPKLSHLPIPRRVMLGLAVELVKMGYLSAAAAVLVSFDTYLRKTSLLSIRCGDVAF